MAWCEDRTTRFGPHHFIYYRINGVRQKPLDGGYTEGAKGAAIDRAEKAEKESTPVSGGNTPTVQSAIEQYIKDGQDGDPGDKESTSGLKRYLLSFFLEKYSHLRVREISIEVVLGHRSFLKGKFSPDGAQMKFKAFKAFLRFCFLREWLEKPLADMVEGIGSRFKPKYLEPNEINMLIEECGMTPRLPELVALALGSGMRQNELFSLEDTQIVENRTFFWVPDDITKTDNGRFVPILDHIRPIVDQLCNEHKGRLFGNWSTIEAMCSAFARAKTRLAKRHNLGRLRFHDLRHSFARMYLLRGGRLNDLADIMGHTNIQTTRSYYSKFAKTQLRDQYNSIKLDRIEIPSKTKNPLLVGFSSLPVVLPQNF